MQSMGNTKSSKSTDKVLKKLRDICLDLPEAVESEKWGKPHFCVGEKIFCGYGVENDCNVIGFKLRKEHAHMVVSMPGFWPAPYVGKHGWVSMDVSDIDDWDKV